MGLVWLFRQGLGLPCVSKGRMTREQLEQLDGDDWERFQRWQRHFLARGFDGVTAAAWALSAMVQEEDERGRTEAVSAAAAGVG